MKDKGQNTVEYIVLVAAVIAVIVLFMQSGRGGFREKLFNIYNNTSSGILGRVDYLANSHQ